MGYGDPEKQKAYCAQDYQAHREARIAAAREYRRQHRAEVAARQRERRATKRAELAAQAKEYRAAHPEARVRMHARERERRANDEAYRERWRKQKREHMSAWMRANPEKARASRRRKAAVRRARLAGVPRGVVTPELLVAKWEYWAGRCWLCSGPANTWDHVKPLAQGGAHVLANLRPACRSCNSSKGRQWPLGRS